MKRISYIALAILAISGFSGCKSALWRDGCRASKKAIPPTVQYVAKTWVGYDEDELTFFRLELYTNGTGLCADVCLPDTCLYEYGVQEYRINRWVLDAFNIKFIISPASTNSEPIYLYGTTSGHTMDLKVGGTAGNWSRKLTLRPEENFTIPNRDTRQALERLAQQRGAW